MPEWWTYSLSDFLLFSPRTYYRLIERHNAALWPAHLVTLAAGAAIALLLLRPSPSRSRVVAATVAALWAWVGWMFVARRYATINWAAAYLAWLFAVQGLLLLWLGVVRRQVRFGWRHGQPGAAGAALFTTSLALYPLLAPALGRGWSQAEVFGMTPDPTALATIGLLLAGEGPPGPRRVLLAIPLAWCALAAATLWALGSQG